MTQRLSAKGEIMKIYITLIVLMLKIPLAYGEDVLVDIRLDRTDGLVFKTPVYQRAIISKPAKPTDTALLFFRGYPGIARIESVNDKQRNLLPFMRMNQKLLMENGIALVIVDCPTDQWGMNDENPTACLDDYRSSTQHADDIRSLIQILKKEHGYSKIYLMGHSAGTISSRWLAFHLGNEITGSIHSASMTLPNPRGMARSVQYIDLEKIKAPFVHVHHENDACKHTPYSTVKGYSKDNLITVRGGDPKGNPCRGEHLHSYMGRGDVVISAIIKWIKTGKIEAFAGE